jgi:hypothetical protein
MHQGSRTQERGGGDGSRDHCVRVDVGGNGRVGHLLLVDAPHLRIFSSVSKATKSQDVLTLTMCNYMARDRYPDTLVGAEWRTSAAKILRRALVAYGRAENLLSPA